MTMLPAPLLVGVLTLAFAFASSSAGVFAMEPSPDSSPPPIVRTAADAAARVIDADARFAGVLPSPPGSVGPAAFYESWPTLDGYMVLITIRWADCPGGCIGTRTFLFTVAPNGTFGAPREEGDPMPPDLQHPSPGPGQAVVDLLVVAGPGCPVEPVPPDPACVGSPIAGAEVTVWDARGQHVASLRSDSDGHALVGLPTGTYVFEPHPVPGVLGTPAAIAASVLAPGTTTLTISYDTGLR
jgi:hypothetical protein